MTATERFPRLTRHANRQLKEDNWRAENHEAIAAHNERVAENGPLLDPVWADGNGARKGETWR